MIFLVCISLLFFLHPIDAGDFFHHLQSGEYIVRHLRLPYTDASTISAYGTYWIDHSWGSGVLYYLLSLISGIFADSLWFAVLGAITAALLYLLLRSITSAKYVPLITSFFFIVGLSLYWPSRPLVMGSTLIIALLLLLRSYSSIRFYLPIFFLVWSVMYGASTILGLGILITFIVCSKERDLKDIFVVALSIIAGMLNGYGLDSLLYSFNIPQIPSLQEWYPLYTIIQEHMLPATFIRVLYYGVVLVLFFLLFGITLKQKKLLQNNIFYALLSAGVLLPFISFRLINIMPVFVAPFITIMIASCTGLWKKLVYGSIGICITIFVILRFLYMDFGVGIKPMVFPERASQFLRTQKLTGNIFTTQETGSYISLNVPSSRIFIDTRDDLFIDTSVFDDRQKLQTGAIDITTLTDKYAITIVVGAVSNVVYKPLFYNNDWKLVYIDDQYFVAVKNKLLENKHLFTLNSLDPTSEPMAKKGQTLKAANELTELFKRQGSTPHLSYHRAYMLFASGDTHKAADELSKLLPVRDQVSINIQTKLALLQTAMALRTHDCSAISDLLGFVEGTTSNPFVYTETYAQEEFFLYSGDYEYVCTGDETEGQRYYSLYLERSSSPQKDARVQGRLNYYRNLRK
ncbi:MAG: hypothetical protein RI947_813 [Candidatus Parcubacteria bacterium]|jgi:hypothetical protein